MCLRICQTSLSNNLVNTNKAFCSWPDVSFAFETLVRIASMRLPCSAVKLINIPMKGKMDSLNLSVTAAIVIFEALKQRNAN